MTYAEAINRLMSLVEAGSKDLVPVQACAPFLSRQQIRTCISKGTIPAIRCASRWLSSKEIAGIFLARSSFVPVLTTRIPSAARMQQIQESKDFFAKKRTAPRSGANHAPKMVSSNNLNHTRKS